MKKIIKIAWLIIGVVATILGIVDFAMNDVSQIKIKINSDMILYIIGLLGLISLVALFIWNRVEKRRIREIYLLDQIRRTQTAYLYSFLLIKRLELLHGSDKLPAITPVFLNNAELQDAVQKFNITDLDLAKDSEFQRMANKFIKNNFEVS